VPSDLAPIITRRCCAQPASVSPQRSPSATSLRSSIYLVQHQLQHHRERENPPQLSRGLPWLFSFLASLMRTQHTTPSMVARGSYYHMLPGSFIVSVSEAVDRRSHGRRCSGLSFRSVNRRSWRQCRRNDAPMSSLHRDESAREGFISASIRSFATELGRGSPERLKQRCTPHVEAANGEPNNEEHAPVTTNEGRATEREISLGAGTVESSAPRVNEGRVDELPATGRGFKSRILPPPYVRRSPKVTEAVPQHSISTSG
jgi:hypothetical protein